MTCFAQLRIKQVSFRNRNRWISGRIWGLDSWASLQSLLEGFSCACFQSCENRHSGESPHGQTVPLGPLAWRTYSSGRDFSGLLCSAACRVCHWWRSSSWCGHMVSLAPLLSGCWRALSWELRCCWTGFCLNYHPPGALWWWLSGPWPHSPHRQSWGDSVLSRSRMAAQRFLHFPFKTSQEGGSVSNHLNIDTSCVNTVCSSCILLFSWAPQVGITAPRRRKHKAMWFLRSFF